MQQMRIYKTCLVLVVAFFTFNSKSNRQFIEKNKTNYGDVKFLFRKKKDKENKKYQSLRSEVDSSGYKVSSFPDRIEEKEQQISKEHALQLL
jgi:hypothetical protein